MNSAIIRRERYLRYEFPWRRFGIAAATVGALCAVTPIALAQARALSPPACPPVRVAVDPLHAPAGARDLVAEAAARVSRVSAIPIVVVDQAAPSSGERVTLRWRPLPRATPPLVGVSDARLTRRGAKGTITLNTNPAPAPDFASRASMGAALMHEIGHAMGLGHSPDPADLMYPQMRTGPLTWGPGDLAQLAAAGAARGCLEQP